MLLSIKLSVCFLMCNLFKTSYLEMSLLSIGGWLSEKGGLSRVTEDSLYTMLREKIGLGWKYIYSMTSHSAILKSYFLGRQCHHGL